MAPVLEFWFDFASTYSYLTAMRLPEVAAEHKIEVRWRPFLLGPIFRAQGWPTSPFNIYPAKGRYMWRDIERRAARLGLPFRRPAADDAPPFPQNSVLAARVALVGLDADWGPTFCRRVFEAEFARGLDIANPGHIEHILKDIGVSPDEVMALAVVAAHKQRLRDQVDRAVHLEVFGAPTFIANGELFWGDDRLEDAVQWLLESS